MKQAVGLFQFDWMVRGASQATHLVFQGIRDAHL